jgi:hypothetical protein
LPAKLVPNSADRGCGVVSANESPQPLISVSRPGAATFTLKLLLSYPQEVEWNPFQTHHFSENLVVPGIEPGVCGSEARNSDHWTTKVVVTTHMHLTILVSLSGHIRIHRESCSEGQVCESGERSQYSDGSRAGRPRKIGFPPDRLWGPTTGTRGPF